MFGSYVPQKVLHDEMLYHQRDYIPPLQHHFKLMTCGHLLVESIYRHVFLKGDGFVVRYVMND